MSNPEETQKPGFTIDQFIRKVRSLNRHYKVGLTSPANIRVTYGSKTIDQNKDKALFTFLTFFKASYTLVDKKGNSLEISL